MPRLFGAAFVLMLAATAQVRADESDLRASISGALVVPTEQRFVGYRWDREPEIVALYFGAAWCGPCHAFTPELERIRGALKEAGADTEVVYVSLDESEREMRRTMRSQRMPWPAIDYRRLRSLPAIRALGGLGPPNLVLVDRRGEVLASGWMDRRYTGMKPVLEAWMDALSTPAPLPHGAAIQSVPAETSP
ncbi:MAG: thioredoxin-like domain-containing protein [Pseudoxanthomonas sp.]